MKTIFNLYQVDDQGEIQLASIGRLIESNYGIRTSKKWKHTLGYFSIRTLRLFIVDMSCT